MSPGKTFRRYDFCLMIELLLGKAGLEIKHGVASRESRSTQRRFLLPHRETAHHDITRACIEQKSRSNSSLY